MVRRVKCPRCSAIVHARGDEVKCAACGLEGRVDAAPKAEAPAKKDPLQITIDLRKLSPANWGPGARAFTMFILLVGVFVAGSLTGMVLERNREGPGGLASTADLFTGASNDSVADTAPAEDTGPAPSTPAAPSVVAADSITLDSNSDPLEPFELDNRLLHWDIEYYGDSSFSARLVPLDSELNTVTVAASEQGDYVTTRYAAIEAPGMYRLEVGTSTFDGNWRITIAQPGGEDAPQGKTVFSGRKDLGKGPLIMSGAHTLTFTPGPEVVGSYRVWAFTEAGDKLPCSIFGTASPDDHAAKSKDCYVEAATRVYFDVMSPFDDAVDDGWKLSIS